MIPAEKAHLKIAAATDPGMKGKNNEDQFSVSAYQLNHNDRTPSIFAIVADGIGGHRAGEVASSIAVEMISDAVATSNGSQPLAIMESAIIQASKAIQAQGSNSENHFGMGTTVVCAWIIGDQLYTSHVGNSRLYLLRNRRLVQLNLDHTWVQEAVDAGALTEEQARSHPHANIIRRYLGAEVNPEVDFRIRTDRHQQHSEDHQGFHLRPGDRLMLCSDGLNDMVDSQEIAAELAHADLDTAAQALVSAANQHGGKDNITLIVLEMPPGSKVKSFWQNLKDTDPQVAIAYAGLVLMGLAVLAALVMYLYQRFAG
jgi:protein phosphatase